MPEPRREDTTDAVSPLELFFDLVFVFAISQLSDHLLENVTWHGAMQTLVMLIAVFGVWSYTSWGSTLPGIPRSTHQWTLLAVMVVSLFMNAGISEAFGEDPWLFVVPYVVCRIGPAVYWRVVGEQLQEHYEAMLVYFVAAAVFWCVGASVGNGRLGWWAVAAVIEICGTWFAHPLPRHRFRTREVAFTPGHMLERSRLFLLIALGEAILTAGTAVARDESPSVAMIVTGIVALIAIIALWALYFGGTDALVSERAETTTDPLRVARLAVNTQILVLASLILLAVANERAIAEPTERAGLALCLMLFGGPLLYLGVQTWYLRSVTGRTSSARLVAGLMLAVGAFATVALPAIVDMLSMCVILLGVVAVSRFERAAA